MKIEFKSLIYNISNLEINTIKHIKQNEIYK